MGDCVIDANVLMGMLISGKASYRPLLNHFHFILPEFSLVELEKYKDILKVKTKLQEDELLNWTYFVFSQLTVLPQFVLSQETLVKSHKLVDDIDPKDISYVALAMQLDLILLTRDKPLYEGLRKKGFRKVVLFEDFLRAI